ncbi:DUF2141 domain-containing protein [Sandaracinus amylolyticus]|uniref:DUF2141 domain-containing protein n=1 Tax=Sandaracinus amylolyticus TaxID=927083 RepID=A0A0F6YNZ2_9BACT|nr:DUF2141 domain-containing protein [Sandaracinus amylolyticus]AKF10910.1 hypothetical protein DB32_008059 [Sandaracinus amylolyticus]
MQRVPWMSSVMGAAIVAVALGPASTSGQASRDDERTPGIVVVMRGLRNDRGVASAGLYGSAATWTQSGREVATCNAPVVDGVSRCRLENVPPGRYAIGVMHDEDRDGEFDTGFLGIPSEGYGFSRDVRGTFGPPSFESASFEHTGGVLSVPITMRYGI